MKRTPTAMIRSTLMLLAATALLASCLPTTPAPTATAAPTATPAATAEPTATAGPTGTPAPTPIPETHLGFVRKGDVTGSGATAQLTIDYVELYTGVAAVTAGAQDGVTVDTDYYIRDNNPLLRTFSIDPACAIRLLDPSGGAEASVVTDVAGLAAFLATVTDAQGALFEIALSGTTVTQILQYYMP